MNNCIWKNLSLAYAEYKGALKESHSYFFELLISYGIVGLLTFIAFIMDFFATILKKCKNNENARKQKLMIITGLLILLLHTLIDFDMSFMLIQLMVYISIAILLRNEQVTESTSKKKYNLFEYGIMIILFFTLSLYIRADISKYLLSENVQKHQITSYNKKYYNEMINDDIKNNKDVIEILDELQDYMIKEPYNTQNENYERYFNLIYRYLDKLSNQELKGYLEFGINRVKNVKEKKPMYFETVIKRTKIIVNTINNLESTIKYENTNNEKILIINDAILKLEKIIDSEYDKNISNLEDFERNGYDDLVKENFKKKYQEVINKIGVYQ